MSNVWWVSLKDLDDEQKNAIELPLDSSVLLLGPPGSGKSNLLLLRARRLVLSNRHNVLMLVFTRALAEYMRHGGAQYKLPEDRVQTSWSWAVDLLREYGAPIPVAAKFEDKRRLLLAAVADVVQRQRLGKLYDTILLDEAQDYLPEEIDMFSQISKHISAAGDSRQKIFSGTNSLAGLEGSLKHVSRLRFHYRTGTAICKVADALASACDDHVPLLRYCNYDESKNRSSVDRVPKASLQEQCAEAVSRIQQQLKVYPKELIGVLIPRKDDLALVRAYFENSLISDYCLFQGSDDQEWFTPNKRVFLMTMHSAKGFEFRAVHLLACNKIDTLSRHRDLAYVAVTRAKTTLSVYFSGSLPGYFEAALSAGEPPAGAAPVDDELFGGNK